MFMAVCTLSGFRGFAEDYYYDVTENSRYQEYEEEVARAKAAGEVQYYDDLKAEKPCAQMEFTIDPLPDYRSNLWANQQSAWTRIKLFFEWLF